MFQAQSVRLSNDMPITDSLPHFNLRPLATAEEASRLRASSADGQGTGDRKTRRSFAPMMEAENDSGSQYQHIRAKRIGVPEAHL
jgi:hypothetical protein